jgi:hypothetical protein
MRRTASAAGLTLAELLVGMGLTVAILGALIMLIGPATSVFHIEPERQDLHQRVRVVVDALERELRAAGAGMTLGPVPGPLNRYVAPIRPYRIGERRPDPSGGVFYRPDVVSVFYVSGTMAQAGARRVTSLGTTVSVEAVPNCGAGVYDSLCGFVVGSRVLLFDGGGRSALGTVTDVNGLVLLVDGMALSHGLGSRDDTAIAEVDVHVFSIAPDAATGVPRLMRYNGFGSELPLVDHVVDLRFEYFGDPRAPVYRSTPSTGAFPTTYAPAPPPEGLDDETDAWGPGENCAFGFAEGVPVSRLVALGAGPALVALDPAQLVDGPWCPDALHPDRFDADLLRIRRVRATVRVEAAADSLRGPEGPLFARPGTASGTQHTLPDAEVTLDVAPWNLR